MLINGIHKMTKYFYFLKCLALLQIASINIFWEWFLLNQQNQAKTQINYRKVHIWEFSGDVQFLNSFLSFKTNCNLIYFTNNILTKIFPSQVHGIEFFGHRLYYFGCQIKHLLTMWINCLKWWTENILLNWNESHDDLYFCWIEPKVACTSEYSSKCDGVKRTNCSDWFAILNDFYSQRCSKNNW